MSHALTPTEEDRLGKAVIEGDGVWWWKALLKWMDALCPKKGIEHVLDYIRDSLDAVAAWIGHWLFGGWGHSYPARCRQRYRTDPSRSGSKDNEKRCSEL